MWQVFAQPAKVRTLGDPAPRSEWKCHPKPSKIPVIGCTADGKYPIYKVEGQIDDVKFYVNGKMANSDWLFDNMGPIDLADTKGPKYKCNNVCVNQFGQFVGLTPGTYAMVQRE